MAHFAARDWDALAKVLADDIVPTIAGGSKRGDPARSGCRDRKPAGHRRRRDHLLDPTYDRGPWEAPHPRAHLGGRRRVRGVPQRGAGVVEINSHNQIAAIVVFDLDDFDAAIAELDARYVAGEAAAHAHTWSVITQSYAALNQT